MRNVAIFNTCISGSTGKIAVGLFNALKKNGFSPYFFYGREDGEVNSNYHRIGNCINKYLHAALAKSTGLQGFGSVIPTIHAMSKLRELDIDTIYIISPHGYYLNEKQIWEYITQRGIRTIYLMIDEYAYLGNCGYSDGCQNYKKGCKKCPQANLIASMVGGPSRVYNLKKKYYLKAKNLVFVGPEYTIEQAKQSPLMRNQEMRILDEAVNTDFFTPKDTDQLKNELGIEQEMFVCVCVAPYSYERKGCKYFVELARRFEGNDYYRFVQVGFNVDHKSVELPKNFIPIGFISDQEKLARYYSLGDLFVFPSLLDTMPNACLEALSSGTPLLLFDISGMPYIADDTVAKFVEARNVDEMENTVKESSKKDASIIHTCTPMFVPIIVPNGKRDNLRRYLISNEIYCPVHWPLSEYHELNEKEKYIYDNELSLVCDQRYTEEDMYRMVDIINQFWKPR